MVKTTKQKSIVLKAHEVQGIQAGRITQIRRVVKPQPASEWNGRYSFEVGRARGAYYTEEQMTYSLARECSLGEPGDVLWVRETWCRINEDSVGYKAGSFRPANSSRKGVDDIRWRSPLFLPRRLSRITLHITDIRVQRLGDMTEEDAIAAGCEGETLNERPYVRATPRQQYLHLWDTINGDRYPAIENPWVWAVTVEVVNGEVANG